MSLLPPDAVRLLKEAAAVDKTVPFGDSFDRRIEVDNAIDIIKAKYPQYFMQVQEDGTEG